MTPLTNVILWLSLGVIARVVVPWLVARANDPENPELGWDWKYVWPQLITVIVNLIILPITVPDFTALEGASFQILFLAGWGASDLGAEFLNQRSKILALRESDKE